ncbi:hypothetical protein GJ496_004633 [Pomphorhynchus laevis]|nr:hypothetical protein GJ496_004633 [Pomphorhynchus laevis]
MVNAPTLSNSNLIKEDDEVFRIENATQRRRGRFNTERKFDGARTMCFRCRIKQSQSKCWAQNQNVTYVMTNDILLDVSQNGGIKKGM